MPDHIHIFICCKVNHYPITTLVKHLKGYSSYVIRKSNKFVKQYKAFYSPSYFVESIGNISETSIKKYIRNQKINLKPTYKYKSVVEKYNRRFPKQSTSTYLSINNAEKDNDKELKHTTCINDNIEYDHPNILFFRGRREGRREGRRKSNRVLYADI